MPTAKKPKTNRVYSRTWFQRGRKGSSHRTQPWFVMPCFNDLHPLEVLKARCRFWESVDEQFSTLHRDDKAIMEKSLRSISEDLRWLASRLDAHLDQGYKSISD